MGRLFRIAARVAGRLDVMREVDTTFESLGIYPPSMTSSGPNKYKGSIDTGWDLEVEEKGGGFEVTLNGKKMPSVLEAAKAYKQGKSTGPPAAAPAQKTVKIAPTSGTVDGMRYNLKNYNYDGNNHERIIVDWTDSSGESIELDAETASGRSTFHTCKRNGQPIQDPMQDPGFPQIAQNASKAFEDAAKQHQGEIPEWTGGKFFDWLMHNGHEVVDGELKLNPEAGAQGEPQQHQYQDQGQQQQYQDQQQQDG